MAQGRPWLVSPDPAKLGLESWVLPYSPGISQQTLLSASTLSMVYNLEGSSRDFPSSSGHQVKTG